MSLRGFADGGYAARATISDSATLFATTMELVALTMGLFAAGAYLGRNLSFGLAVLFYILSFGLLIGMRFTVRSGSMASAGLLFVFGVLMGLATGSTVAYYVDVDPSAVWDAAGATALFMVGLGMIGYSVRRDLSGLARMGVYRAPVEADHGDSKCALWFAANAAQAV